MVPARGSAGSLTRPPDTSSEVAGDVAPPRSESRPDDRRGDFLRGAGTTHRHARADARRPVGLPARGVDVGVDDARSDSRRRVSPSSTHSSRQTTGQRVHGTLGGGVVDVLVRRAVDRGDRGDVDDRAARRRRARSTSAAPLRDSTGRRRSRFSANTRSMRATVHVDDARLRRDDARVDDESGKRSARVARLVGGFRTARAPRLRWRDRSAPRARARAAARAPPRAPRRGASRGIGVGAVLPNAAPRAEESREPADRRRAGVPGGCRRSRMILLRLAHGFLRRASGVPRVRPCGDVCRTRARARHSTARAAERRALSGHAPPRSSRRRHGPGPDKTGGTALREETSSRKGVIVAALSPHGTDALSESTIDVRNESRSARRGAVLPTTAAS